MSNSSVDIPNSLIDSLALDIFNSSYWSDFYSRSSSSRLKSGSITFSGIKYHLFFKRLFFVTVIWLPYSPPSDQFIKYLFTIHGRFTLLFYHNRSSTSLANSFLIKRCSTFLVSLSDDISSSFSKNWSRNLRRSYKLPQPVELKGPLPHSTLLDICRIYSETVMLKNLKSSLSPGDIVALNDIFRDKLLFSLLYKDDQLLSVRAALIFGSGALDILSATSSLGRKTYASHRVTSSLLSTLYSKFSISYYDLNGVDPTNNPGVYNFKAGIGGTLVHSSIDLISNSPFLFRFLPLLYRFRQWCYQVL